jgi:hypothetical protein
MSFLSQKDISGLCLSWHYVYLGKQHRGHKHCWVCQRVSARFSPRLRCAVSRVGEPHCTVSYIDPAWGLHLGPGVRPRRDPSGRADGHLGREPAAPDTKRSSSSAFPSSSLLQVKAPFRQSFVRFRTNALLSRWLRSSLSTVASNDGQTGARPPNGGIQRCHTITFISAKDHTSSLMT